MTSEPELFVGVLSGTSMDGVDCVIVDFAPPVPALIAFHTEPIPQPLRQSILQLCNDNHVSLQMLGETDVAIGKVFATGINRLLHDNRIDPASIVAIGSHGQTVKHHPFGLDAFTLQIGDPNTICAITEIDVVADFRRKDIAAGGQGAPLAPMFHQEFFGAHGIRRAVVNIGGISNVSLLQQGELPLIGFDTGPGNVLMDTWIGLNQDKSYDHDGNWAASGKVDKQLLDSMMQDPFFRLPAPKSTGRELFNLSWLMGHLDALSGISDSDVQATLLELTARSIAESIDWAAEQISEIILCGGGAHNRALVYRLQELLRPLPVMTSDNAGLSPDWVEGVAFAWMARKTYRGEPIDCRTVTGATQPCLLGGIYRSERPLRPVLSN